MEKLKNVLQNQANAQIDIDVDGNVQIKQSNDQSNDDWGYMDETEIISCIIKEDINYIAQLLQTYAPNYQGTRAAIVWRNDDIDFLSNDEIGLYQYDYVLINFEGLDGFDQCDTVETCVDDIKQMLK